jgi:hypothetical protein
MDKQNTKSGTNFRKALEENTLMQTSKRRKMGSGNKNMITKNYIIQGIRIMNKYC